MGVLYISAKVVSAGLLYTMQVGEEYLVVWQVV